MCICIIITCIGKLYIRSAYTRSIFVTYTCIKDTSTKKAYIKSVNNACSRDICTKVSYAKGDGGVSTVKGLVIHLQSSQIIELRQYSTILKTGVKVG